MNDHQHVERSFETHRPVQLYVENDRGSVEVEAAETTESTVTVEGRAAHEVRIELDGDRLGVIAPERRGWRGRDAELHMRIRVPVRSDLSTKLGSADLRSRGELAAVGVRVGSGDVEVDRVTGDAQVTSGSGDVTVGSVGGVLQVKSGSGDVAVTEVSSESTVSTGSGDVRLDRTQGPCVVKTGSGDLRVGESHDDVNLATGSGDLTLARAVRGRVSLKGASGDLRIGIPVGTPVWTDIATITGRITSTIESAGEPEPGADHVELHAHLVSGDITIQPA